MANPLHDHTHIATDNPQPDHAGPKPIAADGPVPTALQVDRMIAGPTGVTSTVASARSMLAPDLIDLGECFTDRRNDCVHDVFFNQENTNAALSIRLEGDSRIILHRAPSFTPPRGERGDTAMTFFVMSNREGYVHATLVVSASWPGKAGETYRIPVRAAVHQPGTPTLEERDAEQRKQEEARKRQDAERKEDERIDREIAEESKRPDAPHYGHDQALKDAAKLASGNLGRLYKAQHDAVMAVANTEIGDFKRKPPPVEVDLLRSIAWAAIDLALDKVTLGVSKAIQTTVKNSYGESLGALVGKGVTAALKKGKAATKHAVMKNASGAAKGATEPAANKAVSYDPRAGFLEAQTAALLSSEQEADNALLRVEQSLRPMVRKQPAEAVSRMAAVRDAFTAEMESAKLAQAQHTVEEWLRLVAHTSVGTKGDHVDGAAAAESFSKRDPLTKLDGVLDIQFTAHRPHDPVAVKSARLLGVRKAVVERIGDPTKTDLKKAHIPIRISSNLGTDDYSITVVRDEAGNIDFDENTRGSAPKGQNWLGQRAGASRDPSTGAAKLMKEILAQPLPKLESDSQD